jgi:hypothetical protein
MAVSIIAFMAVFLPNGDGKHEAIACRPPPFALRAPWALVLRPIQAALARRREDR